MPAHELAEAVLNEIEEHGVDGLRVWRLASRMNLALGTLYSRWGSREACLEHAWRHTMGTIEHEVSRAIHRLGPRNHALDDVWDTLVHALPDRYHAFLELHSARRRWMRGHHENDGVIIPSLSTYVSVAQHLGHVRLGSPAVLAAMMWWSITGCIAGPHRYDQHQHDWCLAALKRMLLTESALALDAEELPIEVDDSAWLAHELPD
jgi:AcrR family transcriptional regulator